MALFASLFALDEDQSSWPSVWRPVLLVALGLLVIRYGVLLGTGLSLHGDEAQYWTWSRDITFGYYSKPPLIAWVIGTATAVCGDAAWCVRAPSALFHVGTACLLTAFAHQMFDARIARWTGITWLLVPAVSYSSLIMSTDAILLFFWSGCLFGYFLVLTRPGFGSALILAASFGLGLNAKYAMGFFLLCLVIHLVISPSARHSARLHAGRLVLAFGLGALMIVPNLVWNASNGWATMGHTADNAHWQGIVLHFDKMAEFLAAQFGVFGPLLFATLILALPRNRMAARELREPVRLLMAFSIPIILIIAVQGLLSRANANWAATAYPAATVLVMVVLVRHRGWLISSTLLHLVVAVLVYLAVLMPDPVARALGKDPFRDLSGWQEVATKVRTELQASGTNVLLMDNRMMLASMAYALRDTDVVIRAWNHDTKIDHHYEMAWLYDPKVDGPRVLLLTPHGTQSFEQAFATVQTLPNIDRVDRAGKVKVLEMRLLETKP